MAESGFATFFQWRIDPALRDSFVAAWADTTRALRDRGSHGSALFSRDDGTLCAFARWPDRAARDAAFDAMPATPAQAAMRAAITETIARMDMDLLCDLWAGNEEMRHDA